MTYCILKDRCKKNTEECNELCASYITMHGSSGNTGRVGMAGIPLDYQFVTLGNSPVRSEQLEQYKVADKYAETFDRQFEKGQRIKSLYLVSKTPGTGKTTTALALANEYLIRHYIGSIKRGLKVEQRPAWFLDVNEWQNLYNGFSRSGIPREIAEESSAEYYRWERYAKETPFVIFDDIGVRSATEAFRSDLHSVINYRVTNWLPSVYTSNEDIDKLDRVFDARLADRIREQCLVIEFDGESKRGLR